MAIAQVPVAVEQNAPRSSQSARSSKTGWLVAPWFDLLFIANICWPLFIIADSYGGVTAADNVRFWQIYFITTPHRWITLALVFLDRNRLREQPTAFPLVAMVITILCGGVWYVTGTLTCLLAIDYVWNAWHFAAQHHGIYRIYGRQSGPAKAFGLTTEKWLLRAFIVYVALRIAGWSWSFETIDLMLARLDFLFALIPVWFVIREISRGIVAPHLGRFVYISSLSTLYLALLWAVHESKPGLVLTLATASAIFHATEYLAIVTWSVRGREASQSSRLWASLVGEWSLFLLAFIVVLGIGGWMMDRHLLKVWLFVNVVVAFLHYAYDGMIWKHRPQRRPA